MKALWARHRGACAMALCTAALVLLLLVPVAALRLGDAWMLGRVRDVAEPYVPRQPHKEDFYLLRQLEARQQQSLHYTKPQPGSSLYLSGSAFFDSQMQEYALQVLQTLVDSGVLAPEQLHPATGAIADEDIFAYSATDSLGFLSLAFYKAGNVDEAYCTMTLESRTGLPVQLWLAYEANISPDPQTVLPAWLQMVGLDTLGDWAVPVGTEYEATGLYSEAGQVLATCVEGDYALDGQTHLRDVTLMLTVQAPPVVLEDPAATAVPTFPLGTLELLEEDCSNGKVYCESSYDVRDGQEGYLLYTTDLFTGACGPFCTKPGCAHTGTDCPAWLPMDPVLPFWAGEELWVLTGPYWQDTAAAAAEEAPAAEQAPTTLSLARYDPARGLAAPTYTLSADTQPFCHDDKALYYFDLSGKGYTQTDLARFVRLDLGTGTLATIDTPFSGALFNDMRDLYLLNGQIAFDMPGLRMPRYALEVDFLYAHYHAAMQNASPYWLLWDPATGATHTMPRGGTLAAVWGDTLYLAGADDGVALERLDVYDLDTGETRTLREFKDASQYYVTGSVYPDSLPGAEPWLLLLHRGAGFPPFLMDLTTGRLWEVPLPAAVHPGPGADSYSLRALACRADGAVLWMYTHNATAYRCLAMPYQVARGLTDWEPWDTRLGPSPSAKQYTVSRAADDAGS